MPPEPHWTFRTSGHRADVPTEEISVCFQFISGEVRNY